MKSGCEINYGALQFIKKFLIPITLCLIVCCGTSTSIVSISEESYRGKEFNTIVVSSPYEDLQIRSSIESLFRRALTNENTKVYRAMDVLPPLRSYSTFEFDSVIAEKGIQCILVIAVTEFWTTNISSPGRTVSSSISRSTLFGVETKTTTKYEPGFTLSQSNVRLDARLFALTPKGASVPIWRANSTTSGNYFTSNSKVMSDAATIINADLQDERLIKMGRRWTDVPEKIVIMGGPDYLYKLGCVSCRDIDLNSLFHNLGYFGMNQEHTLWNPCGIYASAVSEYSACNPNAKSPPILVNQFGEEIGKLSIDSLIDTNYKNSKFKKWLRKKICLECENTTD